MKNSHHVLYTRTTRSIDARQIGQFTSVPEHCSHTATCPHGTKTHSRRPSKHTTHSEFAESAVGSTISPIGGGGAAVAAAACAVAPASSVIVTVCRWRQPSRSARSTRGGRRQARNPSRPASRRRARAGDEPLEDVDRGVLDGDAQHRLGGLPTVSASGPSIGHCMPSANHWSVRPLGGGGEVDGQQAAGAGQRAVDVEVVGALDESLRRRRFAGEQRTAKGDGGVVAEAAARGARLRLAVAREKCVRDLEVAPGHAARVARTRRSWWQWWRHLHTEARVAPAAARRAVTVAHRRHLASRRASVRARGRYRRRRLGSAPMPSEARSRGRGGRSDAAGAGVVLACCWYWHRLGNRRGAAMGTAAGGGGGGGGGGVAALLLGGEPLGERRVAREDAVLSKLLGEARGQRRVGRALLRQPRAPSAASSS